MPFQTPNYQYPEDIPHVSGDRGNAALVVRRDADGALSDTSGDYTLLQVDALGYLRTTLPPVPLPKFARIDIQLIGSTTIVPGVPGKKIRVIGYAVTSQTANAAVNLQFRSDLLTILGEIRELDGNLFCAYVGSPESPAFETGVGEALNINLSILKAVVGHLTYIEV